MQYPNPLFIIVTCGSKANNHTNIFLAILPKLKKGRIEEGLDSRSMRTGTEQDHDSKKASFSVPYSIEWEHKQKLHGGFRGGRTKKRQRNQSGSEHSKKPRKLLALVLHRKRACKKLQWRFEVEELRNVKEIEVDQNILRNQKIFLDW